MSTRKILALLLAVVMICSLFVSPALAAEDEGIVAISDTVGPQFTDVDGHWAESAIKRWAEAGIIEGDGDGTVNPGRNLKRAELATILSRLLGLKERAAADTFSDVAADAWYVDAVLKCAKAGIMQGDGTGKANPESPIDRQQAIVMIGRAVGVKPATGSSLNRFDDGDTVASWAEPYMIALTDMGILNGLPTGEGDGAIIAPTVNIDRASTFALLDKAIAQYITAPCTVTVDDANKLVVINSAAEETGTVTVTGTTAGVVVATGTTDEVVLKNADVGTLKVDAPVDVIISKGSSVDDLDANAAAKIDNKGAVTNLNTNADGVVFDGNKPAKVNTAEGVEPAKDSKGNEVTNVPSSSGGSSSGNNGGTTTYKYNVSIPSAEGGKVTADVTRTNEANTEVTLTVTPNAQTATALPYVLKSLTVKNGETEVAVTDNKFTMAEEGTYTVTAEFVQPITVAELFIVNSEETFKHLADFGYTDNTTDMADLPEMQWIAVGVKRAEGFDAKITDAVLTANGADMSGKAWPGEFGKYSMAYVNKNLRDEDPSGDKLELEGSAYKFVLTFTYEGASYKLECDYLKHGVTADQLHTVTFKTKAATETELVSYKAAEGEKVTVPAAPAIDGWYFTGWSDGLTSGAEYTVGDADKTITANYVKITDQKVEVRPAGPAGDDTPDFDYGKAYKDAGITGTTAVVVDGEKMLADNAVSEKLLQTVGGNTYVFYGLQFTKPEGATSVVVADTVAELGEGKTHNLTQETNAVYNGQYINYINVSKALEEGKVVLCGEGPATFTYAFKWMKDDEIVAVTTATITRTTKLPRYDVTFKVGETTVYTAEKAVEYGATEVSEEVKNAARAEIAKTYSNVTIEFDALTNYTVPVTLTTDVEKLITVTTGTTAFGGDFGDKVTPNAIQDITFAEEKNGKGQIVVEGSLYYTEWPEFSSIQNEQAGYYSALSVPAMENATVKYNEGAAMSLTEEVPPFVTIMGGADAANFTDKGVKLEIDLDGAGPIAPATYVYNFSAVKAVRWDTRNAETGSAAILKNAAAGNDMKPAEGQEGVDDIRVIDGKTYVTFEEKDLPITADHVDAISKETEDGVKMYTAVTQPAEGEEGRQPLPGTSGTFLIEAEAEKTSDHGKGWTLLVGTEAHEETWYFWTVEGKCVKVVFTVPAAPAAQTPDPGADTASLSVVETEDVAAPAPVASYKEDDEVPEIPVLD